MDRPKLTKELITATAAAFCERNGWDAEQAADLAGVCRSEHMDGYELAKALEQRCYWSPTAMDVETLDTFSADLREALREARISWAHDNNVQPPFPVGTMTTRGEITGIYDHDGACYEIRKPGDANPTRRYIVPFEDARAVVAVGAV